MHLYNVPIILRGLIRINSTFGSAYKVSTGCSGVCYGSKTLTDPQTTPFPINRTKCPTGKNSLAHITYTALHTLDEICHTQIVLLGNLNHISEDSEWLLHRGAASHVDLPSCLQHLAAPSSPKADSHVCAYHSHHHTTVCMFAIQHN